MDLPMDKRTTCNRFPASMYCPIADESSITDELRATAYTEIWRSVPGNIAARYSTLPNSKTREFHVDKKCDTYSRLEMLEAIPGGGASSVMLYLSFSSVISVVGVGGREEIKGAFSSFAIAR